MWIVLEKKMKTFPCINQKKQYTLPVMKITKKLA